MRRACLLLLLLCLVALPGCVPESYLLVTPHNSQRGENSDVITVENYAAMRSNLVQQVDRHAEQVSMVTYSYAGDVEQDLQRALDYIQSSYPMGAYALEDATYEIVQVASFYQLQLQRLGDGADHPGADGKLGKYDRRSHHRRARAADTDDLWLF